MKKMMLSILGLLAILSCDRIENPESNKDSGVPVVLTKAETEVRDKVSDFGLRLMKEVMKGDKTSDVLISPLSLSLDMSMCASGAKGETASQMYNVMGFDGLDAKDVNSFSKKLTKDLAAVDKKTTFECANSLWGNIDFSFRKSYVDDAAKYYDAEVKNVDFSNKATKSQIDNWASKHTHDKIQKVAPDEFDKDLRALLINAIYFNGKWAFEFDKKLKNDVFKGVSGKKNVDYLHKTGSFGYSVFKGGRAAAFPYGNGAYRLVAVLPDEGSSPEAAIDALIADPKALSGIISGGPSGLDVMLPKFKVETTTNFMIPLKNMGMTLPFSDFANFSLMADEPLKIGLIYQKAFMDVNEKGTEAAAVTVIGMYKATSVAEPVPPIEFHLNRPFVYLLVEKSTGTILFSGVKRN